MSRRHRSKRLRNARERIPDRDLSAIPLKWTWWKRIYHYGGLIWPVTVMVGFVLIVLGRIGLGVMIALSTIILRRLILWFNILRVEPKVVRRTREVMRLNSLTLPGHLSIRGALLSWLLVCCVLALVLRGDARLLALVGAAFFLLAFLSENTPPFALFLGTSEHSYELFGTIAAGCVPHRAITLLLQDQWTIDKWRARTENPDHWREMVQRLAPLSCVLILDARFPTDAVNEECDWLLTEGLNYKLIVVGDSLGNCPVLDASLARVGPDFLGSVVIALPKTAHSCVSFLCERKRHVPSKEHPACSILRTQRGCWPVDLGGRGGVGGR
jgi:hypothetical protein